MTFMWCSYRCFKVLINKRSTDAAVVKNSSMESPCGPHRGPFARSSSPLREVLLALFETCNLIF